MGSAFFADCGVWFEDAAYLAPATFCTAFGAQTKALGWPVTGDALRCIHDEFLGSSELDRKEVPKVDDGDYVLGLQQLSCQRKQAAEPLLRALVTDLLFISP